jgi:nucleotide-binding universal stress UspA family protein
MRSSPYSRVLVLLDGTERGERALAWARHLARGPASVVHLLMVEPAARVLRAGGRTLAFVDQLEDGARAAARAYLGRVAARLREDGVTVWTHVRIGRADQIVRAVIEELDADVLVLTDGVARPLPPLHAAPIPVLMSGPRCTRFA